MGQNQLCTGGQSGSESAFRISLALVARVGQNQLSTGGQSGSQSV